MSATATQAPPQMPFAQGPSAPTAPATIGLNMPSTMISNNQQPLGIPGMGLTMPTLGNLDGIQLGLPMQQSLLPVQQLTAPPSLLPTNLQLGAPGAAGIDNTAGSGDPNAINQVQGSALQTQIQPGQTMMPNVMSTQSFVFQPLMNNTAQFAFYPMNTMEEEREDEEEQMEEVSLKTENQVEAPKVEAVKEEKPKTRDVKVAGKKKSKKLWCQCF